MTVCIAAICNNFESIIAVSDMKISTTAFSADTLAIKAAALSQHWKALWAASDISHVESIVSLARTALRDKPNTVEEAQSAVVGAFQKHLTNVCTNRFLARLGLDMERFYDTGSKNLTPESFDDLYRKILSVELETEFLVFGFDGAGRPHIFTVSDPGEITHWNGTGFATIGSGAYAAESMLYYFYSRPGASLGRAVYTACVAKFMFETATGVGDETIAFILSKTGYATLLHSAQIREIRRMWDTFGAPRMPATVDTVIPELIETANQESRRMEERAKNP